jgi:hypothetical protein
VRRAGPLLAVTGGVQLFRKIDRDQVVHLPARVLPTVADPRQKNEKFTDSAHQTTLQGQTVLRAATLGEESCLKIGPFHHTLHN